MVKIKGDCAASDCCGGWKEKLALAYERAIKSVNRIDDGQGRSYYPDGTGAVTIPIPTSEQISDLEQNTADVADLKTRMKATEAKDKDQDGEIEGIQESLVSDLVLTFDNYSRYLHAKIERENAQSIDADVLIPMTGWTGAYTPGYGIKISTENVISLGADLETDIQQLKISDQENTEAIAQAQSDLSVQAGEITTLKSTVAQHTNAIGDCFNDASISGNQLILKAVDGQESALDLPSSDAFTSMVTIDFNYESTNVKSNQARFYNLRVEPQFLSYKGGIYAPPVLLPIFTYDITETTTHSFYNIELTDKRSEIVPKIIAKWNLSTLPDGDYSITGLLLCNSSTYLNGELMGNSYYGSFPTLGIFRKSGATITDITENPDNYRIVCTVPDTQTSVTITKLTFCIIQIIKQ